MDPKKYTFDFLIPQGPTGPTGPTGPMGPTGISSGLKSYGGRYGNVSTTLNLSANSPEQVPLTNFSTAANISYNVVNSLVVDQGGVYEITYSLNVSTPTVAILTTIVREDGNDINMTKNTQKVPVGIPVNFSGSLIYSLQEGSVIDLTLSSDIATEVSLNNNASLIVKRVR